jgi:hypothetical protein
MPYLRRTLLRHQMLHACSVGRVTTGETVEWAIRSGVSTYVQMARAVNSLKGADLVHVVEGVLCPTTSGYTELYAWDGKYGQVTR